jgi:hypothetical protein
MTYERITPPMDTAEQSLDAALLAALPPPPLPPGFRSRLTAAIARSGEPVAFQTLVARLEREHREHLAQLDSAYLRMRRRSLVAMAGGAFVAAAVSFALLPFLTESFGAAGPFVLTAIGGLVGFATSVKSWGALARSWPGPSVS